ncbi:hypothetical protein J2W76_002614 [Methylorubrum zatmanii]|nr:hypothetical protein [Methylorubrum zatmanii]MCP1554018.1 hypothetical protein [Methylorubrum extorquens]MCP1579671.1 hypothetical protein [Methylorubrum extorquens]
MTGHAELTECEVLEHLRAAIKESGNAKVWAGRAGVSPQYVSDVVRGRRALGESVLDAIGFRKRVTYERTPPHQTLMLTDEPRTRQ